MSISELAPARFDRLRLYSLAVFSIAAPATSGVYYYVVKSNGNKLEASVFLVLSLVPSFLCVLTYFFRMPEALGAAAPLGKGTLLERWSEILHLTTLLAAIAAFLGWPLVVIYLIATSGKPSDDPSDPLPSVFQIVVLWLVALLLLLLNSFVVLATSAAAEDYLSRTMPAERPLTGSGWRVTLRRLAGRWGAWFLHLFPAKVALALGATLILVSLFLPMSTGSLFPSRDTGLDVILNARYMVTTAYTVWGTLARPLVANVERAMYVLALLAALAALASVILGKRGKALRHSRLLLIVAGILAMFATTDYTFAMQRSLTSDPVFNIFGLTADEKLMETVILFLWLAALVLPIAFWLAAARRGGTYWDHLRIATMIFYLPIFLFALANLPYVFMFASGYVSFWIGLLFLWWGFLQSSRTIPSRPHA